MKPVLIRRQRSAVISRGDIYRDVSMIESVDVRGGDVTVSRIVFPLVIVLTQDCDLSQDYGVRWSRKKTTSCDKMLLSVLVSPLYNAEHVFQGTHLADLDRTMEPIPRNKTPGDYLTKNQRARYHYLVFPEDVQIVPSVIDFKHYFSVNVEYLKRLKRSNFVAKVGDLYREDIAQRFASYLARIGLP